MSHFIVAKFPTDMPASAFRHRKRCKKESFVIIGDNRCPGSYLNCRVVDQLRSSLQHISLNSLFRMCPIFGGPAPVTEFNPITTLQSGPYTQNYPNSQPTPKTS
ncbi:hypothetical protein GQX74_006725 [Glossina fuscipes]|nr:hypothetical protein GQX74_006725 [Glossina fuscipes]